ncbi:hypothetical protein GQ37_006555 [Janthinobacterium sp. BJB1]|nr:hypothetical protein GQ37_006555 [Janthinobacterium sp. BJB1]
MAPSEGHSGPAASPSRPRWNRNKRPSCPRCRHRSCCHRPCRRETHYWCWRCPSRSARRRSGTRSRHARPPCN